MSKRSNKLEELRPEAYEIFVNYMKISWLLTTKYKLK